MSVSKAVPKSPKSSPFHRRSDGRELGALPRDTKAVERGKRVPALSTARTKSLFNGTLFYKLAKAHAR